MTNGAAILPVIKNLMPNAYLGCQIFGGFTGDWNDTKYFGRENDGTILGGYISLEYSPKCDSVSPMCLNKTDMRIFGGMGNFTFPPTSSPSPSPSSSPTPSPTASPIASGASRIYIGMISLLL